MNYSYLSFTPSNSNPIECTNLSEKPFQGYTLENFVDLIVNYRTLPEPEDESIDQTIKHWLQRRWQVCLDYYLCSTDQINNTPNIPKESPGNVNIFLPKQKTKGQLTPIGALIHRKTHRKFQDQPLQLETFSQLMMELNGELFPDIWRYYVVAFNVSNIHSGIYEYSPQEHGLISIKKGLFREQAVKLLCGMSASFSASFLTILSIDIGKALKNYPYNRALREIYIDSGRIAQKLLIKGMEYQIGGLPSPAMRDTPMCEFIGINPAETIPLYSLTMGIIPGKEI